VVDWRGLAVLAGGGSASYARTIYEGREAAKGAWGAREDRVVLTARAFSDGHVACHAVNWDGDGDVDLIAGARRGDVAGIENRGSREAARLAEPVVLGAGGTPLKAPRGDAGSHAADWNGDGDLDLLVGDESGRVMFSRNAGTRTAPRLERGSEPIPAL
jgi:hypothetical protein